MIHIWTLKYMATYGHNIYHLALRKSDIKGRNYNRIVKKRLGHSFILVTFWKANFPWLLMYFLCVSISTEPATHVADGEGLDQKAGGAGKDACRCLFLCVFLFLVFFFFWFFEGFFGNP